jgi:hypothetical protein
MTIVRAQALVLLEPKLSNIWYEQYPKWPTEYTKFVNIRNTQKATVTDFKMTDFGAQRVKAEGSDIQYDDPIFGPQQTYQPIRFALGYKVTDEMLKHELYGMIDKLEQGLMKSLIDGQESVTANLLNGAFGTTDQDGYKSTGFDGLQLCSTAHTQLDGSTAQRNRPSSDADLGVTSLQAAITDFENWKDDRNRPAMIRPKLFIISPEDKFTARELIGSEYKPGTANNEINALRDEGLSFMVSHYKTDNDAWFLIGDKHDLNFIWEEKPRQGMFEDFDAEVIKRKAVQGFITGFGEWRGVWGTSGA